MKKEKDIKQQIVAYARELKMPVFRDEMDQVVAEANGQQWSYYDFMAELLRREVERRNENGRQQRIRRAGFTSIHHMEEVDRKELPKDAQTALPEMETLEFIKEGRNIVMSGNPGTGKTLLATVLGVKACREGYSVFFTSVPHLITQIRECKSQHTLHALERRFETYDLVICDEFGYVSCDKEGGELLFNHLSLRAGKKATIITTNLAFNRWGEIIKDKVLVAALVDRLTHKAMLINMTGESYRLKETKKMMNNDPKQE